MPRRRERDGTHPREGVGRERLFTRRPVPFLMGGMGPSWGTCPSCGAFVVGPPPCPTCGYVPPSARSAPARPVLIPKSGFANAYEAVQAKLWRRTRRGLLLTAIGLLISWIPFVAVVSVFFLSFGSTFLFLGARAAGRKHEVCVVLAFLMLAVGGVVIGILLGAFLLEAYGAARAGLPLSTIRDIAGLVVWGTLPATFVISAAFASQVVTLLPRRQAFTLLGLCGLLAATATLATWFSGSEVVALGAVPIRTATVADFLFRISVYRLVEAPAYVGLAILHVMAYWELSAPGGTAGASAVPRAEPE